jgi:hypothetical protein
MREWAKSRARRASPADELLEAEDDDNPRLEL